jgi:site-specific DNA-methyltransferase (adenine-specific)
MQLLNGDCLDVLKTLPDNSVDSLVTDPPAGISFMGKAWDDDKGGRDEWISWMSEVMAECLRVLKPGAHGLVWSIPRTSHWTAMALEDAGFEVRDCVTHLFGSGFPKSLDISKAIDKAAGAEREVIGSYKATGTARSKGNIGAKTSAALGGYEPNVDRIYQTAPATEAAKQWQGFGTALKPAAEFWWLIRKPCSEKTVAANVLKWGTGALNIDAGRIPSGSDHAAKCASVVGLGSNRNGAAFGEWAGERTDSHSPLGRFPANLVFSHTEHCTDEMCDITCAVRALDEQSLAGGMHSAGKSRANNRDTSGNGKGMFAMHGAGGHRIGDSGGASRFFYCAKISSSERNAGLEGFPDREGGVKNTSERGFSESDPNKPIITKNHHPTVKSKKLMGYLIKLITPPGGTVLDCFMGSGSTGIAAKECGFEFIGIEREAEYFEIAKARIN